jgi:hypothetical protein
MQLNQVKFNKTIDSSIFFKFNNVYEYWFDKKEKLLTVFPIF